MQAWPFGLLQNGLRPCMHPLTGCADRRPGLSPGQAQCQPGMLRSSARLLHFHSCCRHASKLAAKKKDDDSPYRGTVNLPQTKFNMRANSKQREPQLQKWWQQEQVYEGLSQNNTGPPFTLHDGPPYANGDLHCGHALNKVLKDIIIKFQLMKGRRAVYVPGWDCHGLPIELKVTQTLSEEQRKDMTPLKLRRKARDFALKTINSQRLGFQRFGCWGEWQSPYLTLDPKYEAAQLRVFGRMVQRGHIYRGKKPVHWSPSSQTALAEAELEYPDGHVSPSIYVAMPLVRLADSLAPEQASALEGASLAIWTTTPWTIPANAAVAVNANLQYSVVEVQQEGRAQRKLVVAQGLVDTLQSKLGGSFTTLCTLPGSALEGCQYSHPLKGLGGPLDRTSPVVVGGDYITTESGTGLVHTAPGHGVEDYQVGMRYGLPVISPLDDAGVFTAEAGPFQGQSVLGGANDAVAAALQDAGCLLKAEKYPHRYPYDWRSKQPVIFRATEQWFASVDGFKKEALEAIKGVRWLPPSGEARITNMTAGRSDWCISRQRKWGVPIPVFYDKETGEAIMTEEVIEHVAALVEDKGSDAWWGAPLEALLPPSLKDRAEQLRRGDDTMDVWFDSGTSWASVLSGHSGEQPLSLPADLYLEGSDQHRGWFQSSLLTCVAASGHAPYKAVLTHGFVLDERGVKMSKSIGNVTDPMVVMEGGKDEKKNPPYGADVLRLWVASVDFSSDVLVGPKILDQTAEVYRKLRFTLRYLLGNLHDFEPSVHSVPHAQLPLVDRYMLARLASVLQGAESAYSGYQFSRVFQLLRNFAVTDLSNFYLDVAKDRLYVRGPDDADRRACQTVMSHLAEGLTRAVAPVAAHLAEDAWQNLPFQCPAASIFQAGWQEPHPDWSSLPEQDQAHCTALLAVRAETNQVVEEARREKLIGASLEARVLLWVESPVLQQAIQRTNDADNGVDPLRYLFITSQAELADSKQAVLEASHTAEFELPGHGSAAVGVLRARGQKCSRCWNYSERVGDCDNHPQLCERCEPVVVASGMESVPQPVAA